MSLQLKIKTALSFGDDKAGSCFTIMRLIPHLWVFPCNKKCFEIQAPAALPYQNQLQAATLKETSCNVGAGVILATKTSWQPKRSHSADSGVLYFG